MDEGGWELKNEMRNLTWHIGAGTAFHRGLKRATHGDRLSPPRYARTAIGIARDHHAFGVGSTPWSKTGLLRIGDFREKSIGIRYA